MSHCVTQLDHVPIKLSSSCRVLSSAPYFLKNERWFLEKRSVLNSNANAYL